MFISATVASMGARRPDATAPWLQGLAGAVPIRCCQQLLLDPVAVDGPGKSVPMLLMQRFPPRQLQDRWTFSIHPSARPGILLGLDRSPPPHAVCRTVLLHAEV